MRELDVPVLIVGGGPVGLSASLLLSRHGVRSLLVERHPWTSVHPKARALNVRTLELLRVWGLEATVRGAEPALDRPLDVVWAPTLTAAETRRTPYGGAGERLDGVSPTTSAACAQHKLEPILLDAARAAGPGELRFGQELTALAQHQTGVDATIVDQVSGQEMTVRAAYVIAADGSRSPVRSMLGIGMVGPGVLAHRVGIYFRADLREVGMTRPAVLYWVSPRDAPAGVIGAVNLADLWAYVIPFRPEDGERIEDFTAERCVDLVRAACGLGDLEVEVLSVLPWQMAAATAERFCDHRVFLAGDAAHLIPPAGGQAMNFGIQDVHNLTWKLAGHLGGWAGAALLGTYESERRPVAAAVTTDVSRSVAAGSGRRPEQFSNLGSVLGSCYDSLAVVPDGSEPPAVANPVIDYVPNARPGSRAPHIWLWRGDQRVSTLDLFDTGFVLLAGPAGQAWCAAAEKAARPLGMPLNCYVVGPDGQLADRTEGWPGLYGVRPDGAVLVRPDGYVAWRAESAGSDPEARLTSVLRRVLSLDPHPSAGLDDDRLERHGWHRP